MADGRRLAKVLLAGTAALATAGALHCAVNSRRLRHLRPDSPATAAEPVSVLVPARDEAGTIAGCVAALRAQTGVPGLSVRVLDDDSSDATASIAAQAADHDPRVRVLHGRGDPPPGWLGKTWACRRLADGATGSVLVFVDADVRLAPAAVAAAVRELRTRDLDLLSAWPLQHAETPLARLLQPLQQWSWLTTLPLNLVETSPRPQLAAANGQFLIVDAASYRACGGHGSVRGDVLDDIALARAFKSHGLRTGLADASGVAECLMYRTDAEVVAGYSKSLWRAFGGPARGVAAGAGLAAVYTLPVLGLLSRDRTVRALAAASWAAGVAGRVAAATTTGGRVWPDSALQPASAAAFAALAALSAVRHRSGTNTWRGRPVVATGEP